MKIDSPYHLCGRGLMYPGDPECPDCNIVVDTHLEAGGVWLCHTLLYAYSHHPQEWKFHEVREVSLSLDSGEDEPSFTWIVGLADGRWLAVRGWHDYTGWDCRSALTTETYATEEAAFRTLVDWEREQLQGATESWLAPTGGFEVPPELADEVRRLVANPGTVVTTSDRVEIPFIDVERAP